MRRSIRGGIRIGFLASILLFTAAPMLQVQASDSTDVSGGAQSYGEEADIRENVQEELLEQFDFEEVDESLAELFPQEKLEFKETLMGVLSGDLTLTAQLLNRLVSEQLTYAFNSSRENLKHILLIAVLAAVFTNFSNVFQNRQISEAGFYVLYLLMIALCLNSADIVITWVEDGIRNLTDFMAVFCPLYFPAVAIAKGSVTAVVFYNLVLFLLFLVELLIVDVILPAIHIYIMIKILNFLAPEEYLSKLAELLETVIAWTLKTLLACIVGMNVIQSLISPAIDTVKRSALTRSAEAIPGIGDAIGGVTEVVLGTAVLVKNGIGMTGAVFCIALCVLPLVQIGCIVLMYKLAAALIQPVSDKRIVGCIESVGDGLRLLMRAVFTVGLLFLITIVIVSAATGNV